MSASSVSAVAIFCGFGDCAIAQSDKMVVRRIQNKLALRMRLVFRYIFAVVHLVKMDFAHRFVNPSSRLINSRRPRCYAQYAPAAGDEVTLLVAFGSGMKDGNAFNSVCF